MSRAARCLAVSLILLLSGCERIAWYGVMVPAASVEAVTRSHRTVTLTVVDADTGQPLPNVEVAMRFGGWFDPDDKVFVTDAAGEAKHWLVVNRSGQFVVYAAGYHPQSLEPAPDPLPKTYTIRVLREPIPYHVLQVPDDFRGTLVLDLPPLDPRRRNRSPGDPDWPLGKRAWITQLRADRPTTLPSIPQIAASSSDLQLIIRVQTPNGEPLSFHPNLLFYSPLPEASLAPYSTRRSDNTAEPSEVAVWEIATRISPFSPDFIRRMWLFVGTQNEATAAQRSLKATIAGETKRETARGWYFSNLQNPANGTR